MDPNTQRAGTPDPAQAAGEGAQAPPDSAVTAPEGGDAGGDKTDWKGLALSQKDSVEKANVLQKQVQDLEAKLAAQTRPPTTGQVNDLERLRSLHVEAERQLIDAANQGDPMAVFMLSLRQEAIGLRAENELLRLPPEVRDDVRRVMLEQGIPNPKVALEVLRGSKAPSLEQENAQLKAELARLSKAPAPPNTHTPAGGGSTAPAPKAGEAEVISAKEYKERAAKDPTGTWRDYKSGKIRMSDSLA